MRRDFELQPASATRDALRFAWDDETGEVAGPGADEVRTLAAYAIEQGYVCSVPRPTCYDITDPLHKAPEMAAILARFWVLDDFLGDALAQIAPGDDGVDVPGLIY